MRTHHQFLGAIMSKIKNAAKATIATAQFAYYCARPNKFWDGVAKTDAR
jgi:hypothetical protein